MLALQQCLPVQDHLDLRDLKVLTLQEQHFQCKNASKDRKYVEYGVYAVYAKCGNGCDMQNMQNMQTLTDMSSMILTILRYIPPI